VRLTRPGWRILLPGAEDAAGGVALALRPLAQQLIALLRAAEEGPCAGAARQHAAECLLGGLHDNRRVGIGGGNAWYGDTRNGGALSVGCREFDADAGLVAANFRSFRGEALDEGCELGVTTREAVDLVVELAESGKGRHCRAPRRFLLLALARMAW
jgi:hypothetical protein